MSENIGHMVIKTVQKVERNTDLLFALVNVLDVTETEDGYVVTFEHPMRPEKYKIVEEVVRHLPFCFFDDQIEGVPLGSPHSYSSSDIEAHGKVYDFLKKQSPKIEDYKGNTATFSSAIRSWIVMTRAIHETLKIHWR